jgi:hypothetical protein
LSKPAFAPKLITIEDHQMIGGMGAQLIHSLKLKGFEFKVKCLANQGKFGQSAYKADHLYEMHGLDTKSLVKAGLCKRVLVQVSYAIGVPEPISVYAIQLGSHRFVSRRRGL